MKKKMTNVITLDQFKDIHYGQRGTKKRDTLEAGFEVFKQSATRNNIATKQKPKQ